MSSRITALEIALSKILEPNDPVIRNRLAFDRLVEPFLRRKSAVEAMKDYLRSETTAPRVLSLLVYSSRGNALIREWMSQGMQARMLYRAMLNEGSFWSKTQADFPLHDDIVYGNAAWEFEAKEFMTQYEVLSALPGLMEAMIARYRNSQKLDEILRYLPLRTLKRLIREHSMTFAPEIMALPYDIRSESDPEWEAYVAVDILRAYLPPEAAISKILGGKAN